MLSFLTLTTAVYASFPVTENLTEQSTDNQTTDNQNEEAPVPAKESNSNDIDWALAAICFFFGSLGIHRFMMGDTTNGILMLLTAGGCGIWTLIDFINILSGKMSR